MALSRRIRARTHRIVSAAGLAVAAALVTVSGGIPHAAEQDADQVSQATRARCLPSDVARVARSPRTGAVQFIGTNRGRPIPSPRGRAGGRSPRAAALEYLEVCGPLLGLDDRSGRAGAQAMARQLEVVDERRAARGGAAVRLQQFHQGVPIVGGEVIVRLDGGNDVLAVVSKTLPAPGIDVTPGIGAAAAAATALAVAAKAHGVEPGELSATPPALWIYDPGLLGHPPGPETLVWRVEVVPRTLRPIRELVLIDAHRGAVILHFNQVETAQDRKTYTANNSRTLPGLLVCAESDPECRGGDSHAAAAHVYTGDTYAFYAKILGRNSLDDAGMTLTSTVHYGADYRNAFWSGAQMVYGDGYGFAFADDVVGHELTHGVTQFTSNLFYYYQSGAISESLSDLFGEFVDQTNGSGNDAPTVKWLVGEDITGLGAIRSMQDPPAFGDPDRMTSAFYFRGGADNGGVHTNSGVNNKAAYLMVEGGFFNGRSVTALGLSKVAKIYYEVQTHLLTSGADYADLYEALVQGCHNLVGTSGITAGDCDQVREAALAVEMNLQPAGGPYNPEAPLCPDGWQVADLFFDDLESGSGNFVFGAAMGTVRWGYDSVYGPYAHSGRHFLFADDHPAAVTDTSARMTGSVLLPPGAFLHFAHAFGFEGPNYDGGVLEFSGNGGSTWEDAGPLFDANGYNGTVATGYSNPLARRAAFVSASNGYISSRVNLSSLAGKAVAFRWRMGLDVSVYNWGWWVDDVRVYTCTAVTGTVSGHVRSAAGEAVSGAQVRASGYGDTTDSAGFYTFVAPIGTYELTASAPGFATASAQVTVTSGGTAIRDFVLQPQAGGHVTGQVRNGANDAPIPGARVTAEPGGYATLTDAAGRYNLAIPPGTYAIAASAPAYTSSSLTGLGVTAGATVTRNFVLAPVVSQTFVVDSTVDAADAVPGDGHCVTSLQTCSLRAAIQEVNALPAAGYYAIALPAGVYTLTIPGRAEYQAATGDLNVQRNLTINGAGRAATLIDANALDRAFQVYGPATVTLNDVTVRNGDSAGDFGGCVYVGAAVQLTLARASLTGCRSANAPGGALLMFGSPAAPSTLVVSDTNVSDNASESWGGGIYLAPHTHASLSRTAVSGNSATHGGGLFSIGGLSLDNATVSGNTATLGEGGGVWVFSNGEAAGRATITETTIAHNTAALRGGGLSVTGGDPARLDVVRSTISGNSARSGGGLTVSGLALLANTTLSGNSAAVTGGAIEYYQVPGVALSLVNVTVAANAMGPSGAQIDQCCSALDVKVRNSIVSDPAGASVANCRGVGGGITDLHNNLEFPGTSCGFADVSDRRADPRLRPLSDNGGPTLTHAVPYGSPAIRAGDAGACAVAPVSGLDQRGFERPPLACDIGAYDTRSRPFTDEPLVPGVTTIRAVHVTELRGRIDLARAARGLAPFAWTDPLLLERSTVGRAVHIVELRAALSEAYAAAGRTPPVFSDDPLVPGRTPVRAVHITELRAALVDIE